jgi:hypothetical protein
MYLAPSYFKVFIPLLSLFGAFSILAFQHIENSSEPIPVAPQSNPIVLELFTSQSCPNCENADFLANTIKDYENVIVLSYHIDYWNQLGWMDTFSDSNHTNYQRDYERRFDRNLYAPQMVVNGRLEFDGANIRLLNSSLKKQSTTEKLSTPQIKRDENKSVSVSYDFFTEKKYDKAYALLIIDSHNVAIDNGPNIGKIMTNTNIVINRTPLQMNSSKGNYTFELPPNITETDQFKVAIILQDNNLNIIGASVSKIL